MSDSTLAAAVAEAAVFRRSGTACRFAAASWQQGWPGRFRGWLWWLVGICLLLLPALTQQGHFCCRPYLFSIRPSLLVCSTLRFCCCCSQHRPCPAAADTCRSRLCKQVELERCRHAATGVQRAVCSAQPGCPAPPPPLRQPVQLLQRQPRGERCRVGRRQRWLLVLAGPHVLLSLLPLQKTACTIVTDSTTSSPCYLPLSLCHAAAAGGAAARGAGAARLPASLPALHAQRLLSGQPRLGA